MKRKLIVCLMLLSLLATSALAWETPCTRLGNALY